MKGTIGKIAPKFVQKAFRLLRYHNERKKFIREINIRKKQDELIQKNYSPSTEKLIIFLVPGSDWATGKDKISGGIISIVSICEETGKMKNIHDAETILCTMNEENLLLKHEMFANNTPVYRFEQLYSYFNSAKEILIHIPEYLAEHFIKRLSKNEKSWLAGTKLQINILNQNIKLMPGVEIVNSIKQLTGNVTISTAHKKYCTKEQHLKYGTPLHKLSVWISPESYQFKSYDEKENLLVVSPDYKPMKDEILEQIGKIKDLRVQVIQNLTYESYKELISRAKWSLTFGEGLDGYFIEPAFSGAISFAVYNELFFTPDFKDLRTVYPSYDTMLENIVTDISYYNEKKSFVSYQEKEFKTVAQHYSYKEYKQNIEAFYKRAYTFQ